MFIQANPGIKSSGTLQCFCDEQYSLGSTAAYDATYGPDEVPMCATYLKLVFKTIAFSNSLKYVLAIFNFVIRTIVIMAVTWIGYATNTAQLERITTVTFLC